MPAPQGEAYERGINIKFKRFATTRYETGEARPQGEAAARPQGEAA